MIVMATLHRGVYTSVKSSPHSSEVESGLEPGRRSGWTRRDRHLVRVPMDAISGPRRLAERARGLLRAGEPLVQAGRVELVVARLALEARQVARRGMDDHVTNRALLDPFEDLVDVLFPQHERVRDLA